MFDSVCGLFGETIRNKFWYGCHFAVECYGSVSCGGALLDIPLWYFKDSVCCVWDINMHLSVFV